jgi:small subunit ribosomal protein S11
MYPDENTPTRLFNGIPFRDVPICDIKASKNNTIISVSNAQGGFLLIVLITNEYGLLQY